MGNSVVQHPLRRAGRVAAVTDDHLVVRVVMPAGCTRCERGGGCGLGLAVGPRERDLCVSRPAGTDLRTGDPVTIALDRSALRDASVTVYGIPLGALMGGAAIASGLGLGDVASIAFTAGAFLAGLLAARRVATGLGGSARCRPRLCRDAGGPSSDA